MEFTTEDFTKFRKEAKQALKTLEDKFDIEIELGSITYSVAEFTCKMNVKCIDKDTERIAWDLHCADYGLKPSDFNAFFEYENECFQLMRIHTRRHKYPIEALNTKTGNSILFTEALVRRALSNKENFSV